MNTCPQVIPSYRVYFWSGFFLVSLLLCSVSADPVRARTGTPIRAEGLVEAVFDAALSPQVSGIVASNLVEEGDWVEAGQLLVQFIDTIETLEVSRRKLILDSKVELEAADKRRALLEQDLQSTRKLFESSGTVSKDELDLKKLEYELADAELQRIQQTELREVVEYKIALEQQAMRKLIAPAEGEVTRLLIDPGEYISSEQPLLRLVDTRKCTFISNLPAHQVGAVKKGQSYTLEFGPGEARIRLKGKAVFISPVTDAASGLRMVKLEFENPDLLVSPGTRGYLIVE